MGQLLPIVDGDLAVMEDVEINDLQLIYHVRDALIGVAVTSHNFCSI